jgi:hypothetical protein
MRIDHNAAQDYALELEFLRGVCTFLPQPGSGDGGPLHSNLDYRTNQPFNNPPG